MVSETSPQKDEKESSSTGTSYIEKDVNKPELVFQTKTKISEVYYGVFIPSHLILQNEDIQKVHTDKSECLKLLKRYSGSRFKGFPTYDEALYFSEYGPKLVSTPSENKSNKSTSASTNQEKPSLFRGPDYRELIKFRKAIEKGNTSYFDECVNNNPRFLVSSGDTPSILRDCSRHNALHIACRNDQPSCCKRVLSIISTPDFFQRLYPDDTYESSERRCIFLLDLYLNTPDKCFNETPLHYACKHGALECTKTLLSYPACDKALLNKDGQNSYDIICTRLKTPDRILTKKIQNMFEETYFVPVLRDKDHCLPPCIGAPLSPVLGKVEASPTSPFSHGTPPPLGSFSPISPLFKVSGYAGPMSPQKADDFYSRWKKSVAPSPLRSAKAKTAVIRISDHEKGLERIGRDLAAELDVEWVEQWEFLGTFVNITSLEGLMKLEQHLKETYAEVIEIRNREEANETLTLLRNQSLTERESPNSSHSPSLPEGTIEDGMGNTTTASSTLSSIGELCQDLEALRLNASLSPNVEMENPLKKPLRSSNTAAATNHDFFNRHDIDGINASIDDSADESFLSSATEQYNFAVQSARISSLRLSSILNDVSGATSDHVGPDFQTVRTLRNKMKPEVRSLRKVLGKCFFRASPGGTEKERESPPDFRFVHVFVAAKTVEHLMVNVAVSGSVLFLASETLKLLTGNIESFEESSSSGEDEGECGTPTSIRRAKLGAGDKLLDEEHREEMSHFRCIVLHLERALEIGMKLMKEGKDEEVCIDLSDLDECHCSWHCSYVPGTDEATSPYSMRFHPVDVRNLNNNNNVTKKEKESEGRLSRAHSFLQRVLFGKKRTEQEQEQKNERTSGEENRNKSKSEVFPVFKSTSVVKQLSFDDDLKEEKNEEKGSEEEGAISKENGKGNEDERERESDEDDDDSDSESFASAVSSLEEDQFLATPDEEVKVYIHGVEPTKDDLNVYIAIEGIGINEKMYPHVGQWLRLMETHSKNSRERWPRYRTGHDPSSPLNSSVISCSSPLRTGSSDNFVRKKLFPLSPI